jgi:hypothetical protein
MAETKMRRRRGMAAAAVALAATLAALALAELALRQLPAASANCPTSCPTARGSSS